MEELKLEEYRDYPAKHYSMLKQVYTNPKGLIEKKDYFGNAMKLGDAVDILMFTPELFNDKYIVSDVEEPTGQLLELVNECFKLGYKDEWEVGTEAEKLKPDGKNYYFGNTKDPVKRLNNWNIDLFWNYLKFLNTVGDKHIITIEQNIAINNAVNTLKNHIFTKDIFNPHKKFEVKRQWPLLFNYKGHEYKILLDYVLIDHKNKRIFPYDLKTMEDSPYSFRKTIFRLSYWIQSSLYSKGLEILFPDYKIEDFKDIVYSFSSESILIYNMNKYKILGEEGWEENGFTQKGWLELSNDVDWHHENKLYDYSREIYMNNGEIVL